MASPQPGPVQIDLCRLDYNTGGGGFGMFGLLGALAKSTGQLKIKFTNESDRELSVVRFFVTLEGNVASVRDVGKFSPGITVDHGFKDFAGSTQWVFSRQPQPKCKVTFVKYADGTAWGADVEPEPAASPEAAASPAAAPAPSPSP